MNNMNGIISECQHIYNSEVEIKDTKNGATRAIAFYSNAKARIAEEKEKQRIHRYNRRACGKPEWKYENRIGNSRKHNGKCKKGMK